MSGLPVIDPGGSGSAVSVSSLPPTPAGTNNIGTVGLSAGSAAIGTVSVSNFPSTQTIAGSVTANIGALNGAALADKQPELGVSGTPSPDVITVQGITNGTPQAVLDLNSGAITAPTIVTPSDSATFTPPRLGLTINATVKGDLTMKFANGVLLTWPVEIGANILPYAPTQIMQTGTTVVGTFHLNN